MTRSQAATVRTSALQAKELHRQAAETKGAREAADNRAMALDIRRAHHQAGLDEHTHSGCSKDRTIRKPTTLKHIDTVKKITSIDNPDRAVPPSKRPPRRPRATGAKSARASRATKGSETRRQAPSHIPMQEGCGRSSPTPTRRGDASDTTTDPPTQGSHARNAEECRGAVPTNDAQFFHIGDDDDVDVKREDTP